jgi:O-antigen/teichoic acid export membrane protein
MVPATQRFSSVALRLSLSSVSWVTVEKVAQQVLWLVLFSILAPILGPGPYGVFSIVMVFIGSASSS